MSRVKMWTTGVPVDPNAIKQLNNTASLPFIYKHIAVMPDVHLGKGSTIGSVIPTVNAVIPAAVGVDIGCGMVALRTYLYAHQLPDNLHNLRCAIEAAVPHGRSNGGNINDKGSFKEPTWKNQELAKIFDVHVLPRVSGWSLNRAFRQMGTLGTGNHFIELSLDEESRVWIMIHSGSRGIGNAIGRYFIEKAKEEMQKWCIHLPDQDLAYLPKASYHFDEYLIAVSWAQEFAKQNRFLMLKNVLDVIQSELKIEFSKITVPYDYGKMAINCHHNYVTQERHFGNNIFVTRKGAVSAKEGELGIIPGSMGAKSFIVKGKGNRESFMSCSHGAGRVMSRTEAHKLITMDQHIEDTQGVECRKDESVIDESPRAYKDIDAVMKAQEDLVEIVHTLKQVLCVKG